LAKDVRLYTETEQCGAGIRSSTYPGNVPIKSTFRGRVRQGRLHTPWWMTMVVKSVRRPHAMRVRGVRNSVRSVRYSVRILVVSYKFRSAERGAIKQARKD